MTLWWKLGIVSGYTAFIFALSWHIHTKFDDADKLKIATKQLESAHKTENKIVKFNQDLRRIDAKDTCLVSAIPSDINELLK